MPDQEIALTLKQATDRVPFSEDYLRKAVKRTEGNVLPARYIAKKYTVEPADLRNWYRKEGVPA